MSNKAGKNKTPADAGQASKPSLMDDEALPLAKRLRSRLRLRPRPFRKLSKLASSLPTRGNKIQSFFGGKELFESMLHDILSAQSQILMEIYIFRDDECGQAFAKALKQKAMEGLEVRVIYDSLGSISSSRSFFADMRQAGVKVLEYHPIAFWRKGFSVFGRNHRKTLILDQEIGYIGGVNIGNEYTSQYSGDKAWRDTHCRLEGPAARDIFVLFCDSWHRECGENLLNDSIEGISQQREPEPEANWTPQQWQQVYVIGSIAGNRRRIKKFYQFALGRARSSIVISCSYFSPDRAIRKAITFALKRNVDVQLLLPQNGDVLVAHFASRSYFTNFLKQGLKIYLYKPRMLHTKTAVIDSNWATIGSANLDCLSFRMNKEANVVIVGQHSGMELLKEFDQDLLQADRLREEDWNARGGWSKLLELLARLLRHWV